jgi:CBS domain containing-hemolysin-like protein
MEPPLADMLTAPNLSLTLLYIALSFVLVFLNAFFVAAEFAIVKVRRTRLKELEGQGVAAARISILCVDNLDEYLSATQLGITLVSLALGWVGEQSFFNLFVILFPEKLSGVETGQFHAVAIGLSFFIITFLHVVLGELVPKSMAIQKAEKITLFISRPLRIFYRIAKPLINTFTAVANLILKAIGYHNAEEPALSEEELKIVVQESHEEGVLSASEAQIINKAFEFADKRARDIMIPCEKVQYISLSRSFEENKQTILSRNHTRFPVCRTDMSTLLGIINMKDLRFITNWSNDVFVENMEPPLFVEPSLREDRLMKIFSEKKMHLAVVKDPRNQKILGIVTLEDVLEQIVGEIIDEHGN